MLDSKLPENRLSAAKTLLVLDHRPPFCLYFVVLVVNTRNRSEADRVHHRDCLTTSLSFPEIWCIVTLCIVIPRGKSETLKKGRGETKVQLRVKKRSFLNTKKHLKMLSKG